MLFVRTPVFPFRGAAMPAGSRREYLTRGDRSVKPVTFTDW